MSTTKYQEPKFQPGQAVVAGDWPMQRDGFVVAFGPYKEGRHHYFVQTNLGEVCYGEWLIVEKTI